MEGYEGFKGYKNHHSVYRVMVASNKSAYRSTVSFNLLFFHRNCFHSSQFLRENLWQQGRMGRHATLFQPLRDNSN